jgi:hypothetical protein
LTIVVGQPGSGKSTLIAASCVADHARGSPVVALDPSGDLARMMVAGGVSQGTDGVQVFSHTPGVMERARKALLTQRAPVVVFYDENPRKFLALGELWVELSGEMRRGYVYACDEAEMFFPSVPHSTKDNGPVRAAMLTIARNRRCRIVLGSKRPQRLHTDARENAARVCVFRSDSFRFIEGCANFGDPRAYQRARTLNRGEFLYRDDEHDSTRKLPVYNTESETLPWFPLLDVI